MPGCGTMEILQRLNREAEKNKLQFYLVGGFLRDSLAGVKTIDMDLTGPPGALSFAAAFSRREKIKGQRIERHGLLRLHINGLNLDISDFKGETLYADLAQRDFTINAMALPLSTWLEEGLQPQNVVDPFDGLTHFGRKRLQALPGALARDPLRVMRGARLALNFALLPDEDTRIAAHDAAKALPGIPKERIAAEIFTVLQGKTAGYLLLLEMLGAVESVFGKQFPLRHDFVTAQTESLLSEANWPLPLQSKIERHLSRPLTVLTRSREIIKLGALLCDVEGVGKIRKDTLQAAARFLSAKEQAAALLHIADALCRLDQSRTGLAKKELYHYFKKFGSYGADAAILYCALAGPRALPVALRILWEYFLPAGRLAKPPQYLTGKELAAMVGKARLPSKKTGELQEALARAAALQHITGKTEALEFAKGYLDA